MSGLVELEIFKDELKKLTEQVEKLKNNAPYINEMNGILDAINEVEWIIDLDIQALEEQSKEISNYEYDRIYNSIRKQDVL